MKRKSRSNRSKVSAPTEAWKNEFNESLKKHVLKGDYKSALVITKKALADYPRDFVCRFQHAKIVGDYADELPAKQKKKFKTEAIRILKPLLRSLRGVDVAQRFSVCLNYYYQTESFKEMHAFGKRFAKFDRQRSFYARGLSGALHAQTLYDAGKLSQAKSWAERGVAAWSKYDLAKEKYYFAHYSYAKALAIAGQKDLALKALRKAAKLGQRPVTDWEFADVMKIVESRALGGGIF
ncbi:MAG: hypothetical protein V4692_09885 [Bdellovibrionota bacterium]